MTVRRFLAERGSLTGLRHGLTLIVIAVLYGAVLAGAVPASAAPPRVDYADPAHWVCRPGVDDGTCSAGLDAVAIAADGTRSRERYVAAKDPPVDCFYLYPTSSLDPTPLSDLRPDEEKRLVHDQAARFGAVCRLFAPIYHQITVAGLKQAMARAPGPDMLALDLDPPYRDVRAAWRYYLRHDNHGRGVVLIGHSQGALLVKRLIAREIERRPAARLLVAAYMAGILTIDTASFRSTPPCATAAQTGCFLSWSSYAADHSGPRLFGRAEPPGQPICVDPAHVAGTGPKAYLHQPETRAAADPPFRLVTAGIEARCVTDARGAAFRVAVAPGPEAAAITAALPRSRAGPAWDLHPHDIELVQGTMLDLIATQSAGWAHRRAAPEHRLR